MPVEMFKRKASNERRGQRLEAGRRFKHIRMGGGTSRMAEEGPL